MAGRVVVTGMGIISAIGSGTEACLSALRAGESGIRTAQFVDTRYALEIPMGEVAQSTEELLELSKPKFREGITRTELLAYAAFLEAVHSASLSTEILSDPHTALISATTVGGMVQAQALYNDAHALSEASPYKNSYRSGAHTLCMANEFELTGYTDTINTACSSSANAIMLGARLLRSGRAKRAIVGGTDSLSKYTVNGFNSLQILSSEPTRPFDANRKGLSLGEGAAYLVLEPEENLNGRTALATVSGYANRNDAHHPSSMSPDGVGVIGAMTGALHVAGLQPSAIGHINAHGTGTQNNDHTELYGLEQIFGQVPPFISTKSYTGHTLAAAGAIEAVFSILSLQHDEIWPSLRFAEAMSGFSHTPNTAQIKGLGLKHVMSNSFGFGGNCSSIIFSKA